MVQEITFQKCTEPSTEKTHIRNTILTYNTIKWYHKDQVFNFFPIWYFSSTLSLQTAWTSFDLHLYSQFLKKNINS